MGKKSVMSIRSAMKIVFVSVVRDFQMYEKCIAANPSCKGAQLHPIDNREKNEFIPVCYNRFLDQCDLSEDKWIVFCHEDFQPHESLYGWLENADKNSLHGPIGVVTKNYLGLYYKWVFLGKIETSDRLGGAKRTLGERVCAGTRVDTFDCQCLIVHSSLLRRTGMRFDEHLSFDLYVEDFCIQANENHAVSSVILPFRCQHWSDSLAQARYDGQLSYLKQKWPNVCYTGTCAHMIGGGIGFFRRFDRFWKDSVRSLIKR